MEVITRNLRAAAEVIGRAGWDFDERPPAGVAGVGAEVYTAVVTPRGTWGSFDMQLRYLRASDNGGPGFEVHNLELEKRLLYGRLNVRAGHFQAPFGLEALPIDTHTTLLQLSNPRALGFKHDWGAGASGQLDGLDYDLAYTLGAGMDPALPGAGLFTGRIGWEDAATGLGFGVSGLAGERRSAARSETVFGWRSGLDLRWSFGPMEVMTEGSAGEDAGDRTGAGLLRVTAETPGRLLRAALQGRYVHAVRAAEPHRVRAETELALRLPWLTRGSFLRLDVAREGWYDPGAWSAVVQLYLRFDV